MFPKCNKPVKQPLTWLHDAPPPITIMRTPFQWMRKRPPSAEPYKGKGFGKLPIGKNTCQNLKKVPFQSKGCPLLKREQALHLHPMGQGGHKEQKMFPKGLEMCMVIATLWIF